MTANSNESIDMHAAICLVGPTGIGKTAVALAIAKKIAVEIISADSRQIYKYLDIGTAKPSRQQLQSVTHHFIDILEPQQPYNAGEFGREARKTAEQIIKKKKVPLIAGGAGFYIQAFVDGLSEIDIATESAREQLRERWEAGESAAIYEELRTVDPQMAARLKKNDKQRIIRAMEVFLAAKRRLSDLQKSEPQPAGFAILMVGLRAEREILYHRINARVDEMLTKGLVSEVEGLARMGYDRELNALNSVGYKEVFDFLENKLSYDEMVREIKKNSRRYAKRQLTWFRRDSRIHWLDICRYASAEEAAEDILALFAGKKD